MYYYEHQYAYGLGLLFSVLKGFSGKVVDHSGDTASVAIVAIHKSCCSPLDSFDLFGVVSRVWVPYCDCIFHLRSHKGSEAGVLDIRRKAVVLLAFLVMLMAFQGNVFHINAKIFLGNM